MSELKQKLLAATGIVVFFVVVSKIPWAPQTSGLTEVLHSWGAQQEQTAEEFTDFAVSGVEGTLVGEDVVDGSNWSIPNVLRNLFAGG